MSKPRPVKAQQKKTATDFPSRKFETPLADPHAAEAGIVFPGGRTPFRMESQQVALFDPPAADPAAGVA
jgi:hypothetical protein